MSCAMRSVSSHLRSPQWLKHHTSNIRRCASCYASSTQQHQYLHSTATTRDNTDTNHIAHVRSALSSGPLPYEKGWAWQHVLLNRRLSYMRRLARQNNINNVPSNGSMIESDDNNDWLLLFEHEPVYTLGRGASEDHLTFLENETDQIIAHDMRRRLSRTYRGKDASRLNIDQQSTMSLEIEMTVEEEVNHHLSNLQHKWNNTPSSSPVYAPNGSPIYRIERGGEVTYHGPGQLVIYPMLNLKNKHQWYQPDLHWYLRQIEEVIIRTLHQFDIPSNRDAINTGVWVGQDKIAAVGVSASKWITTHGLAMNVTPNLDHFGEDMIRPCGIEGRGVTSIAQVLAGRSQGNYIDDGACPTVEEVGDVALQCFGDVFGVELARKDPIR